MSEKMKAAPGTTGTGSGNNQQHEGTVKIKVEYIILKYCGVLLEIHYSDNGKQYQAIVVTKELDILCDESKLIEFVFEAISTCKMRRARHGNR